MITQTLIYPLETVKTRLSTAKTGEFTSILACARTIVREGGAAALFRGIQPALIGILPYAGIDLAMVRSKKRLFSFVCVLCK
jgi:solute carrier family 25 phosphate transporter 23/24/25/41